jgi:hypothetical protein
LNHFVHQDAQRRPKQNGPPVFDWQPEMHLQQGLEGQVHTKLKHPWRTHTEYAASISDTEGLSARILGSSGNTVDRTTAFGKPGGHHARRLVKVGEVGHIVEANTRFDRELLIEPMNPASLEVQGSGPWEKQLVGWGLRHYRSHGADLLQVRKSKQASGDQLLAGGGWLVPVGRVVGVD